ncbi:hypothetical protein RSOLAG1IB_02254 [Rhizoctonia solani AG-1 IB]|uniref:Uncharacterized protein n=1 Tax=Thanatephorus cucumeris (strain AG1-IB / isolate 7/3/14) TaxID=1108050 RepID=A0A0B7FMR1_THACB|nr:hypothetical protein RSOLAG1IB_02254 [Rhizoctonia solani AG-1 IB]
MPTRPIIPPRSQTPPSTPVPSPPKRPSNALRRFGTILPGSTLQSYRLSTPLSRDARGRAPSEASKPPCLIPNDLPTPPPGVIAKDALSPWPGNTRIMVHRMNISRHEWNTLHIRIESVTRYIRLALEVSSSTTRSAPRLTAHPLEFIRIADTINGIFVHTKRMAVIGCDRRRHEEVEALAVVRAAIHELAQTEIATEPSISLPLESGPSPEALVATGMNTMVHAEIESPRPSRALTREPRATSSFRHHQPIAGVSHRHHLLSAERPTSANSASFSHQSVGHSSICGLQSTITDQEQLAGPSQESPFPEKAPTPTQKQSPGPDPQPHQKRSRVRTRPAPYLVPSTRILRSMTKAKEAHSSTSSTAPPDDVSFRTAVPRRQLRKESKAKPIPSTDVVTPPKAIAPNTSRYNLRPRKRELDNSGIPPTVGKQIDRPAKRRRT